MCAPRMGSALLPAEPLPGGRAADSSPQVDIHWKPPADDRDFDDDEELCSNGTDDDADNDWKQPGASSLLTPRRDPPLLCMAAARHHAASLLLSSSSLSLSAAHHRRPAFSSSSPAAPRRLKEGEFSEAAHAALMAAVCDAGSGYSGWAAIEAQPPPALVGRTQAQLKDHFKAAVEKAGRRGEPRPVFHARFGRTSTWRRTQAQLFRNKQGGGAQAPRRQRLCLHRRRRRHRRRLLCRHRLRRRSNSR